jgi:hypothetical protein
MIRHMPKVLLHRDPVVADQIDRITLERCSIQSIYRDISPFQVVLSDVETDVSTPK